MSGGPAIPPIICGTWPGPHCDHSPTAPCAGISATTAMKPKRQPAISRTACGREPETESEEADDVAGQKKEADVSCSVTCAETQRLHLCRTTGECGDSMGQSTTPEISRYVGILQNPRSTLVRIKPQFLSETCDGIIQWISSLSSGQVPFPVDKFY